MLTEKLNFISDSENLDAFPRAQNAPSQPRRRGDRTPTSLSFLSLSSLIFIPVSSLPLQDNNSDAGIIKTGLSLGATRAKRFHNSRPPHVGRGNKNKRG